MPRDVVQERYERLVAVVEDLALAENRRQVGRRLDVLVAEGAGRKDVSTARRSGRAPDNRLVHFAAEPEPEPGAEPVPAPAVRPGDVVTVEVSYAAPHHLVAGPPLAVRRTRAGDAWSARQAGSAEAAAPAQPPTLLGLPRVGALG